MSDGIPAYPIQFNNEFNVEHHYGLTKLELVSSMLLQGILANPEIYNQDKGLQRGNKTKVDFSKMAIENAKELLKQLSN